MGGFVTGLAGAIGQKIQEHNERNIGYQHQAQEEQARQYDTMAQNAEKDGNYELATDLHKASFGIRTTMPGQKPKLIKNPDGTTTDPLDMQGIFRKHTELQMKRQEQQARDAAARMQGPPTLAPNGVTPQQPAQPPQSQSQSPGSGYMGMPSTLQQLVPPPAPLAPNLPGGPTQQNSQRGQVTDYYNK